MAETCVTCGDRVVTFNYCDEEGGPWCPRCWPKTPCGQGDHGEGCATLVFDDHDEPPPAKPPTDWTPVLWAVLAGVLFGGFIGSLIVQSGMLP